VCQTSPNARVSPFLLDDLEDIRMLVHASHEGVMVDLAETPGECDLLLGRERLAAEEDHQMLEPGGFYFLESFIVKECEIDAGDLGTERACDGLDFDPPIGCHGLAPRARANGVTISRFGRAVCDKLGLAWAGASGRWRSGCFGARSAELPFRQGGREIGRRG
jgi:hypothetical protein